MELEVVQTDLKSICSGKLLIFLKKKQLSGQPFRHWGMLPGLIEIKFLDYRIIKIQSNAIKQLKFD